MKDNHLMTRCDICNHDINKTQFTDDYINKLNENMIQDDIIINIYNKNYSSPFSESKLKTRIVNNKIEYYIILNKPL